MKTLILLGRQPAIGLAELESLFGADSLTPLHGGGALIAYGSDEIDFQRLGGAMKACSVLETVSFSDWKSLNTRLHVLCTDFAQTAPEGKLTLGFSLYGIKASRKDLERTALSIKKSLRSSGRSIRIVPNKNPELSTPQVIHNKLTSDSGCEIVVFRDGQRAIIARTTHVQNIESYTARDQARPARDSRVGMLPPKLAQTLINLATPDIKPRSDCVILDPFCGTGVVLQEALLMGFGAFGTDIDARMIDYSKQNIQWLKGSYPRTPDPTIFVGDATTTVWKPQPHAVACEGYLGLPFAHLPSDTQLQGSVQTCNTTAKSFLKNLASQTQPPFRACIGLPAWHIGSRVRHLPLLEQLHGLGWRRVEFTHAKTSDLIYRRDDQIVGRELVVLERS